jgi:hypothetical protein
LFQLLVVNCDRDLANLAHPHFSSIAGVKYTAYAKRAAEQSTTTIMAGKEATVYILDLGKSMVEKRYGRDQTDLDWAMEYVWDKITTTVSRRSFGDLVRQLI